MFELRDSETADRILAKIRALDVEAQLMHVCGTHQDTLIRHGLDSLLEDTGITIRQGPGCPVCVTTPREIEEMLALADAGKTVAAFGDMMRVPGEGRSLLDAKADGADVRIVYSIMDAVRMAADDKDGEVVFMGIGFETTVPSTAFALLSSPPPNFSVLSCHRTVPNALRALVQMGEVKIQGLIEPGHVSTIIGEEPYRFLSEEFHVPQVIAGFEPLDLLMGIYMLAKQVKEGRHELVNEYTRVVKPEGNPKAVDAIHRAFKETDVPWRGFPVIPGTGLDIGDHLSQYNARARFDEILQQVWGREFKEPAGCRCGEVLRGILEPEGCPLFGGACKPSSPVGPCMVSAEGGCAIAFKYGMK